MIVNEMNGATSIKGPDNPRRVRLLPEVLSNKIAAGEVVQRPAAVLKELVENSLDSGANRVEVRLQDSGRTRIFVQDDGLGMDAEDAKLCFKRHATSKIQSEEDLENILTLGFRGEALASIAAVAQVTVKTSRRDDDAGYVVEVRGGAVVRSEPCAAPPGTSVDVRNLFYNVPARRNFLKTPATELKRAVEHFQALAISQPTITFELYHNDSQMYYLPASVKTGEDGPLKERISDLFGKQVLGKLIPVTQTTSYVSVYGFLGSPDHGRRNRSEQFLFVNGRYVRSRSLGHAIASSYEGLLQEREYPFYVLCLELDTRHVDVNVHPTKMEIQFDDDRGVYSFLKAICQRALATAGMFPTIDAAGAPITLPFTDTGSLPSDIGDAWRPVTDQIPERFSELTDLLYGAETGEMDSVAETDPQLPDQSHDPSLIWQLHNRYVLAQVRTGLLIVDQRAAQERILYERALRSIEAGSGASQQLLFPQTIELSPADFSLVQELLSSLSSLGFSIENFGGNTNSSKGHTCRCSTG